MQKILFTVLALLFSATVYAQSTEPRDFRGMEWDSHYSAIPGLVKQFSRDEKIDVFKRSGEDMTIGSCPLDTLTYETFSGRFYKVKMTFSKCDPASVFNMFKQKYGECTKIEDSLDNFICTLDWKRVKLEFAIDSASGATEIVYVYKITEREYNTYLKEKAGTKKDSF